MMMVMDPFVVVRPEWCQQHVHLTDNLASDRPMVHIYVLSKIEATTVPGTEPDDDTHCHARHQGHSI